VEQEFALKKLELKLKSGEVAYEDLATVFIAMQHQNFVLANSITNLVEKWPKVQPIINEVPAMFGILLENKD
jgi:secreted PhoX family phosphatase